MTLRFGWWPDECPPNQSRRTVFDMSAELTRVQQENAELRKMLQQLAGHKEEADRHIKTIAELRHEIEVFTLDAHAEIERWRAMYFEAQAEIKRLRAEIELVSK